jgi:hypothetical protein
MSSTSKIPALAFVLALGGLLGPGHPIWAGARDRPGPAKSARGEASAEVRRHRPEVFPAAIELAGLTGAAKSPGTFTVSLMLVDTEHEAIEASPPEAQGGAVARAPYVYGPGSNGFGYYAVPAAAPVRATPSTSPRSSGPVYRGPGTGPRRFREFGTGRSVRLAKPWLNPN